MDCPLRRPSVRKKAASLFLLLNVIHCCVHAVSPEIRIDQHGAGKLMALLPSAPLVLPYHGGPILTGPGSINLYILWYGNFSAPHKATIRDFLASIQSVNYRSAQPSVSSWWATTKEYKDSSRASVAASVKIGGQTSDVFYTLGKSLKRAHIARLIRRALARTIFPKDDKGIYMVLTAEDVYVERFCMNSCGYHDCMNSKEYGKVLVGWVGNSGVQCPGQCAWPFAAAAQGPPTAPLLPPNGDVGVEGMIINIATVLAGTATNPWKSGYYQGSALAPLEAATACAGIFGKGAYSGYPGEVLVYNESKGSFNAHGIHNRTFLLPAMWDPTRLSCKTTISS